MPKNKHDRGNKLNSILNRTLSDSILYKRSIWLSSSTAAAAAAERGTNPNANHGFNQSFYMNSRRGAIDFTLSRKNSTNRRSIIHNNAINPVNFSLPPPVSSSSAVGVPTGGGGNTGGSLLYPTLHTPTHHYTHSSSTNLLNKLISSSNSIIASSVPSSSSVTAAAYLNNGANSLLPPQSPSNCLSMCSSHSPSPITVMPNNPTLLLAAGHPSSGVFFSTPPTPNAASAFKGSPAIYQQSPSFGHHQQLSNTCSVPLGSPKFNLDSSSLTTTGIQQPSVNKSTATSNTVPVPTNNNNLLLNPSKSGYTDTRRWSFASIQSTSSSGYAGSGGVNTPPNEKTLNRHKSQAESSMANQTTALESKLCFNGATPCDEHHSLQQSHNGANITLQHPPPSNHILHRLSLYGRSRMSSSNDSSQLDDSSEAGYSSPISFHRHQRARSLSCSPTKSHAANGTDVISLQNEKFRDKYPRACKQMEEQLHQFVETAQPPPIQLDPAARFIHSQIVELAKLCLEKSRSNQLTCSYFDEISSSLERLLAEAGEKCYQIELSMDYLTRLIKKFLLIISRVARLLECIEFDPTEFCHLLDHAEQQAKQEAAIKADIPKYIVWKLGLVEKDLFDHLNLDTESVSSSHGLGLVDNLTASSSISSSSSNLLFGGATINPMDEMSSLFSIESTVSQPHQQVASSSALHTPVSNTAVGLVSSPSEDDFEEIKLISNGAYGAVHLVRHKQSGERFAMKKIKKQNILLRNQIQQVFTERDIMTFTDNPFVVAMVCTFETKKHLCMVMEYVEGGDVATLIKNMGPLPVDMARAYIAETTLAVEYLHNYGIIHRDLKPDNLLITSLGHVKLTDFGLSKIGLMNLTTNFFEETTGGSDNFMRDHYCKEFNDKQICGTPQYLAPEVILRQRYGKTVDWWSMGIILYEFLTSIPPFNGNTPEELFSNVIAGEILWPDDPDDQFFIPDDARSLITGLLTQNPIKRLGANMGALEIKQHAFFRNLDWNNLLRMKAEFIPQLDGPEDTSYFDNRLDRYNHDNTEGSQQRDDSDGDSNSLNCAFIQRAESSLSINRNNNHANQTGDEMSELFQKKLNVTSNQNEFDSSHNNITNDMLDIDTDNENELFASFSSCSSKFRLGSISSNNSPVLFMNERAGITGGVSSASSHNPLLSSNNLIVSSQPALTATSNGLAIPSALTPPSHHHQSPLVMLAAKSAQSHQQSTPPASSGILIPSDESKRSDSDPSSACKILVVVNDHESSVKDEKATRTGDQDVRVSLGAPNETRSCSTSELAQLTTQAPLDSQSNENAAISSSTPSLASLPTSTSQAQTSCKPVVVDVDQKTTKQSALSSTGGSKPPLVINAQQNLNSHQYASTAPTTPTSLTLNAKSNTSQTMKQNLTNSGKSSQQSSHNNTHTISHHASFRKTVSGHGSNLLHHQLHSNGSSNNPSGVGYYRQLSHNSGSGNNNGHSKLCRWSSSIAAPGSTNNTTSSLPQSASRTSDESSGTNSPNSLSGMDLTSYYANKSSNRNLSSSDLYNQRTNTNSSNATNTARSSISSASSQTKLNLLSVATGSQQSRSSNKLPVDDLATMGVNRSRLTIKRGARGFGFVLRAIKVYTDHDSTQWTIQHLVIQVDEEGPAYRAGLRPNDVITHVNEQMVCGKMHSDLIKLIMANNTLNLHTVPLGQSNIRTTTSGATHSQAGRMNAAQYAKQQRYVSPATKGKPFAQQGYRPAKSYYFKTSGTVTASSSLVHGYTGHHPGHHHNQRRSIGASDLPPPQSPLSFQQPTGAPVPASTVERKKKTLLRKVSEKGAKKYNFSIQQQPPPLMHQSSLISSNESTTANSQLTNNGNKLSSSSSSSSSSSLNNSFNLKVNTQHQAKNRTISPLSSSTNQADQAQRFFPAPTSTLSTGANQSRSKSPLTRSSLPSTAPISISQSHSIKANLNPLFNSVTNRPSSLIVASDELKSDEHDDKSYFSLVSAERRRSSTTSNDTNTTNAANDTSNNETDMLSTSSGSTSTTESCVLSTANPTLAYTPPKNFNSLLDDPSENDNTITSNSPQANLFKSLVSKTKAAENEAKTVATTSTPSQQQSKPNKTASSIISSIKSSIQQPLSNLSNRNAFKYINRKNKDSKQTVASTSTASDNVPTASAASSQTKEELFSSSTEEPASNNPDSSGAVGQQQQQE